MKLNIIIPAYNEEKAIGHTLRNLAARLTMDYRLVIIDDCSFDNTPGIIREFVDSNPSATAILNKVHHGYVEVLKQGIKNVEQGEVLLVLMADGCDDIALIEAMYKEGCNGADIVCACRYMPGGRRIGGARFKAFGSWFVNQVLVYTKKIPCCDLTNSFKIFKKEVFDSIDIESTGFEIFMEAALKAYIKGYRIIEMPTVWKARKSGKSKFKLWTDGLRYMKWVLYGLKYIN